MREVCDYGESALCEGWNGPHSPTQPSTDNSNCTPSCGGVV
jgi:hypothetical protein